jgi:chromosome segregation ATPase
MKILSREQVVLTKAEKQLFGVSGKTQDIENLDAQIQEKKQEFETISSKMQIILHEIDTEQKKYDVLAKQLASLDILGHTGQLNRLKNDIEETDKTLSLKRQELVKVQQQVITSQEQVKILKTEQTQLKTDILSYKNGLKQIQDTFNLQKENLTKEYEELKEKTSKQKEVYEKNVVKSKELLDEAVLKAKNIFSQANEDAKTLLIEPEQIKKALIKQNEELEKQNQMLKVEHKHLVDVNKVESLKAGKKLEKLAKEKAEIEKREENIAVIKQQALNDIYKTAKQHKVSKVNQQVKELL